MSKYSVGLDFGTTSISIAVLNNATKKTIYVDSKTHSGFLDSNDPQIKEQNPDSLFNLAHKMLDDVLAGVAARVAEEEQGPVCLDAVQGSYAAVLV